jgi:hypothetical protein
MAGGRSQQPQRGVHGARGRRVLWLLPRAWQEPRGGLNPPPPAAGAGRRDRLPLGAANAPSIRAGSPGSPPLPAG